MRYMLDTNAFWKVLEAWTSDFADINPVLKVDGKIQFCISEITEMEIYSVLGKYTRVELQEIECKRTIKIGADTKRCSNIWLSGGVKPGRREAIAIKQILDDILCGRDERFLIVKIPLTTDILQKAKHFLQLYASKFELHSLDATIAATAYQENKLNDLTLITYDKALKNVLERAEIKYL